MENNKSSHSWWWDSHNSPHQSQWLQSTLSDLDEKIKSMLTLVQEDGDSFAQRAEMYYKKRPELINMVEEFHRSYRSLAQRYDQLRPESTRVTQSGSSSSSNSFKHVQNLHIIATGSCDDSKLNTPDSHPESVVEDPDLECNTSKFDFECLHKIADEFISTEQPMKDEIGDDQSEEKCDTEVVNKKINGFKLGPSMDGQFAMSSYEREGMWSGMRLQVSKLMEDNLRQQAELIRRNDEKREAIKDLCFQIDKLMVENKALHNCLRCSNVGMKQNQSQISKLKELIVRKFLGGSSP